MKQILVVEDDRDITTALQIRLEASGYAISTAADSHAGVQFARELQPDLMILDICMPEGDGFQIVETLQADPEWSEVPFIMLTATKRPEFRDRAEALGAAGYFEKPYQSAELLDCIEASLTETGSIPLIRSHRPMQKTQPSSPLAIARHYCFEIRGPLGAILATAEVLEEKIPGPLNSDQVGLLQAIIRNTKSPGQPAARDV